MAAARMYGTIRSSLGRVRVQDPEFLRRSGLRLWEFDQELGDLVIVPPGVPHEVLNVVRFAHTRTSTVPTSSYLTYAQGKGLSFAVAANIISTSFLMMCWRSEQRNRTLCTRSIYRLKTAVFYGVTIETERLVMATTSFNGVIGEQHHKSYTRLLQMLPVFREIVSEEELPQDMMQKPPIVRDNDQHPFRRTCDDCQADIFNRRFHCDYCGAIGDDGWDLCIQCYTTSSKTPHRHAMLLVELIPLVELYELLQRAQETLAAFARLYGSSDLAAPSI